MSQTAEYLQSSEAANILHVSPKTISRWAREGKLPFILTLGGWRRYPEAEILALRRELSHLTSTDRPVH